MTHSYLEIINRMMQAFKISMIKNVQAVSLPQPISFFISFEVHFIHNVVYAETTFGVLKLISLIQLNIYLR